MAMYLFPVAILKINLPHIHTPAIQYHFTAIHPKGFINRNVTYPASEADCNIMLP